MWAKGYGNLNGVLFWDNVLVQQWPGSGAQVCQGLNKYNFLNTFLNGAYELSMGM